ncbi:DUF5681 domain-containing protein [Hyphomicrobium sp.]|uniref:DUF5681 domain-containing protein n=1 Tax=Hyphomicrobium sp. TaxID=82 RepID=UPI0025C4C01E|nr:DUF5681 domain-containing protein [Hyphomicrobium sp.]MCC7251164.1 hypothetical protein [Hyphomicrobium sp.]
MKKGYAVGYGKPPKHSRFKRGQSGNLKGRPKAARGIEAILRAELQTVITVEENGFPRKFSKRDVIIKRLVNKAVQGDAKSLQIILNLTDRHGEDPTPPREQEAIDKLILQEYGRRLSRKVYHEPAN